MKEIIITATVLILFILLIRRIFRERISSRLQYALWLLVVLRLVLPVSAKIDLGPLTQFRLMDLVEQVELEKGDVVERLEEPIHIVVDSQSVLYRLVGNEAQKAEMAEMLDQASDDGPTVVFMAGTLGFTWMDILGLIWTAGMLTVGLWIIVSNALFSYKLKKSRQPFTLPDDERALIFKKNDSNNIFQNRKTEHLPAFYVTDQISSPCLYGFFRREAVYLTEDVTKDPNKLRHVLVHELVHKKHGDSFWALLRSVLVTVYWFHPLVWVAAVCSKRDCELACDEGTLALLGEEERISYGETLLSIITRKSRLSDLVCTATTMTGSGKSVKERIQFIARKPRVLYAAVAVAVLLTAVVCVFVFTQNPRFSGGMIVNGTDGINVTGADMQIRLPASIGGISGYVVEEESDDVVIYHVKTQREVGRFSRMTFADAIALVDEGREVLPIGYQGYNFLLRAYMGGPVTKTEHTYTIPEEKTEHTYTIPEEKIEHVYTPVEDSQDYTPKEGASQGVLSHEDIYIPEEGTSQGALWHEDMITDEILPNESVIITDDPIDESAQHIYTPAEENPEQNEITGEAGISGIDSNNGAGVPGMDSNVDITYVPDDNDDTTYIVDSVPDGAVQGNPMLSKDWEWIPLEEEEEKRDYLPNEQIRTTEYHPREITADEIDAGCYVYVKADYGKINGKYLEEMEFIDSELRTAAGDVIILSLNRERREALFDALTQNRTPYVGDNTKVGALLAALPIPPTLIKEEGFSLQTVEKPYSLRFKYEMSTDFYTKEDQDMVYFNAAMLFYSIGNVEEITVDIKNPSGRDSTMNIFYRENMEKDIPALQGADYENDQIFRDKLSEVHIAVEEHLSSALE